LLKSATDPRSKSNSKIVDEDIPSSQPDGISRWHSWRKLGMSAIFITIGVGVIVAKNSTSAPTDTSSSNALTQTVDRQTLPVKISANGIVKADRSINLSPKTAGTIKTLLVKEGDRVKQGQVIALMDDTSLRGELVQSQGQLLQQQANLQRLRSGSRPQDIAKAEAQLAEVTANLRQLQAGNRPEDIAKAEAQLAEVTANLRQLQAGNRPQEIAQATARLQQSQATLTQKQRDWQRYQELYRSGAISGQILEQKRADRDVSQNQVLEYQQALALQKAGTRWRSLPEVIGTDRSSPS
jgi:HlyD family secretion protein